jgi:hypothetical protein
METRKITLRLVAALVFLSTCMGPSFAEPKSAAKLLVTILDENGSLFQSAHIYIFSSNKKKFFGTREASGMTTFDLPAGDYRIYAGMTMKTDGIVDHFSSPEANVSLSSIEPTSVILTLQKAQDSEMVLSDTARQKMEIDAELAKYLN